MIRSILPLLAAAALLAGCADPKEVALLRERNDQLTAQLSQLDERLTQAANQARILQANNQRLRGDLETSRNQVQRLQNELAETLEALRNARMGDAPPPPEAQSP